MNIYSVGFHSVYDSSYSVSREVGEGHFILIVTKSRAVFEFGDVTSAYPAGTAVLYGGGNLRSYRADSEPFVCDWIDFDSRNERDFFDSLELRLNQPVRLSDCDFISGLIRNISSEFYSISSRRVNMLDNLMKTLLMKLSETGVRRDTAQVSSEPHYSSLIDLRSKIYRNPQLKWNVDSMAADVNMSRSYFQHLYSEVFGVSCMTDVINGKIEKAKEILSETNCTISQVASMCGYDNEEHFMRQFKKIVGTTPTRYRKNR
ncbi:MAG: AraC family transcriptional regulator [Ruminococcus sp.]|nr:AraC family transcriptional regulator [Ruminococcus sp.]